ncbi:hypothetical protein [Frankia sp. R82]|uniref:hypothetical protein n=1 Tax=Frankia sp. R82 TaxID=2950553 RepID=UPI002043B712|nr:hypothetical protein [Frankia sp. R82]MCM3886643.1 hypothetical protein [Frankia sp. R82]
MTTLDTRRPGPTVRQAVDTFLDAPKIASNAHTLRAYANVLDRAAEALSSPPRRA